MKLSTKEVPATKGSEATTEKLQILLDYQMIYLRTYTGASFPQNERLSLGKQVSLRDLVRSHPEYAAKFVNAPVSAYMWDFGVRNSSVLKENDTIYILSGSSELYATKIGLILKDPEGGIGDYIGWHRIHGQPWKNPVVFSQSIRISHFAKSARKLVDERNYLNMNNNLYQLKSPAI